MSIKLIETPQTEHEPMAETKIAKCMKWLASTPGAKEADAVGAGFTKSAYYIAKKRLRNQREEVAKAEVQPALPPLPDEEPDPLEEMCKHLRERGITEFHFRDGELSFLQWHKRRIY
jgi:hypothetical protein